MVCHMSTGQSVGGGKAEGKQGVSAGKAGGKPMQKRVSRLCASELVIVFVALGVCGIAQSSPFYNIRIGECDHGAAGRRGGSRILRPSALPPLEFYACLLYTSDAADE